MRAKRFFSILLCILMLGSIFPVSAFAEEDPCAGGHDYVSELTVPPTQDSEGIMTWSCTRCGDSYTESVPRLSPDPEPQTETFSVFYELCGHGDEIAPVTAEAGSLLVRPEEPQADGYVFQGWYRDAGYEAAWDFDQDTVQEETTLFAYWVEESPVMLMGAPLRSGETVYTVILDSGEKGIGGPFTYRSDKEEFAEDWRSAVYYDCKFYMDNGKTCFWLKNSYNPFTAQQNYVFDGWEGNAWFNELNSEETTFTAKWREDLLPTLGPIAGIPAADGGTVYLGGIPWRIIGQSDSAWLLISAEVLGDRENWETAKGLCDTLYNNGLSQPEQDAVAPTSKQDGSYRDRGDDESTIVFAPADLSDARLFLLSAPEARWYFSNNDDRLPGEWWLRSPAFDGDYAGSVSIWGGLGFTGVDYEGVCGARPAFQLNLASVLFESAAEGVKSSAATGGGVFGNFRASSTNGRKLTLIDSDRSGFSANVGGAVSATVVPGGALAVTYSGANTGENEYVSAMLTVGDQTYYASLTSAGSGTWNMTLPDDLAVGSSYTLKVFSEKQNGDTLTDYASSSVEITLTVSDTVPTTYAVTVNGGSGGGDYAEGASVTITANEPEAGMQFKEWTSEDGVTFTDASSATTTFTMPAQAVTITATYEAAEAKPEFKSHTLVLSGQIGVNFYVDLSMLTEAERKAVTMDFTVNGKKTTDTFDASFTNPSTGEYFGFTCYINSVQMADEITAELHYGDGDTVSHTYSAKQYVDHVLSHTDDYSANAVALVKAIADYGHYVQPFLADNNGWTVGMDHAAMDGVNTYSETDVGKARTAVAERAIVRDVGSSQIAAVSYSLNLESETAIRIYLKVQEGYTGEVTATMDGEPIACVKQRDGRYRIEVGRISAHKLGDVYDITVFAGGEFTISVSALSYVNTALTSESSVFNNEAAHYAVTSLYNYYVAAMAYKNNPNN